MPSMQQEIQGLREGNVLMFLRFYQRISLQHPDSNSKADLILHAACDLVATDFTEQDAVITYLFEDKIFTDPNHSGYFLTDFGMTLREGAAILKDAMATALYLRKHQISIPVDDQNQPDLTKVYESLATKQLDILAIQQEIANKINTRSYGVQQTLVEDGLEEYKSFSESQLNLYYYIREYRDHLKSTDENAESLQFFNDTLAAIRSDNLPSTRQILEFIQLVRPTTTWAQFIWQQIKLFLVALCDAALYKKHLALRSYHQHLPNVSFLQDDAKKQNDDAQQESSALITKRK